MSLRRNTLWNLAGSGLPLIAAACFIPYTLNQLGSEAFGVLTLIWALIGYFSLFDMGVGRALTFALSQLAKHNHIQEISLTLKAGLLLTLAAGALGTLIMWVLAPFLAERWLNISVHLQQDVLLSFQIAAIGVIPASIYSGLRGALEGLGRFAESNINKIVLGLCIFTLPAIAIALHGNQLWIITLYLVLARVVTLIAALIQLRLYLSGGNRSQIKQNLKPLLNYGVWLTVSGIISPLMVYGDRFFVSAAVGATLLPIYAIPQEGLQRLLMIPLALSGALLPLLSASSMQEKLRLYQRHLKRITLVMCLVCSLAAALAYPIFKWWISLKFAQQALPITFILCVGMWLNSIAIVPYTFLHANGHTKITALFHLVELVFYAVVLWWLAKYFGLIGAALAWVARVLLDLILLHTATRKFFVVQD